ncbi:MAG TPA: response regulator, partial [Phenylobacterium sp.]|nr:response regulator [Phenylobacterium sp.]
LMDVRMPVMDGLEATRRIRAREQAEGLAPTPIIGLSADAMAHQVEALLAAGMDAHVAKPIDAARLYGVLEKVV